MDEVVKNATIAIYIHAIMFAGLADNVEYLTVELLDVPLKFLSIVLQIKVSICGYYI